MDILHIPPAKPIIFTPYIMKYIIYLSEVNLFYKKLNISIWETGSNIDITFQNVYTIKYNDRKIEDNLQNHEFWCLEGAALYGNTPHLSFPQ